jgi:lipoate---protein ligase
MTDPKARRDVDERTREDWNRRFASVEWTLMPNPPLKPRHQNAMDEVLLEEMAAGRRGPHLRFWNWASRAVIIGRFQSVRNEIHEDAARAMDVTISRRMTGGGAMLVEPEGSITYTIAAPESLVAGMSFAESYEFFDSWVIDALKDLGVDAWYVPLNDITSTGGKLGGAAQARKKGIALHHTTMAYQMAPGVLTQILRIGKEKLSDKGVTSADKRVGPLRQQTEIERSVIIDHMISHFRSRFPLVDADFTPAELARLDELVKTKYDTEEWVYALP